MQVNIKVSSLMLCIMQIGNENLVPNIGLEHWLKFSKTLTVPNIILQSLYFVEAIVMIPYSKLVIEAHQDISFNVLKLSIRPTGEDDYLFVHSPLEITDVITLSCSSEVKSDQSSKQALKPTHSVITSHSNWKYQIISHLSAVMFVQGCLHRCLDDPQ